jgi:hypothetical protein
MLIGRRQPAFIGMSSSTIRRKETTPNVNAFTYGARLHQQNADIRSIDE